MHRSVSTSESLVKTRFFLTRTLFSFAFAQFFCFFSRHGTRHDCSGCCVRCQSSFDQLGLVETSLWFGFSESSHGSAHHRRVSSAGADDCATDLRKTFEKYSVSLIDRGRFGALDAVTVINDDDVDLATIVQSTTTTAASASSSSSQLGLIILVLVVLGAVGFFVYRKRAKRNQTTARTLGGTPPSPTVSQSEQNRSSLWSNKGDQSKVRNFNIV